MFVFLSFSTQKKNMKLDRYRGGEGFASSWGMGKTAIKISCMTFSKNKWKHIKVFNWCFLIKGNNVPIRHHRLINKMLSASKVMTLGAIGH